jgi:hypothetical protein
VYVDPTQAEEFLEHFGVKGMHWGVRRGGESGGSGGGASAAHKPSSAEIYIARRLADSAARAHEEASYAHAAAMTKHGKLVAEKAMADAQKKYDEVSPTAKKYTASDKVATTAALTAIGLLSIRVLSLAA